MRRLYRLPLAVAVSAGSAVLCAFAILALPAAAGGGCHATAPLTEGSSADVQIANCAFTAGVLRVPMGTTVKWTNRDFLPHVVSGVDWGRTETVLNSGDTFSHAFAASGIYPYTCTLHPGMSAVVLVGDVAVPPQGVVKAPVAPAAAPAAPVPAAPQSPPLWPALAIGASLAVGALGFVAGRALARAA